MSSAGEAERARTRRRATASVIAHLLSFKKTIGRFRMGSGGAGADAAGEPLFTARTISKQGPGSTVPGLPCERTAATACLARGRDGSMRPFVAGG